MNTTNLCGGKINLIRSLRFKKISNRSLIDEIKFCMSSSNEIRIALRLQDSNNRRTHHASMACDIYFRLIFHNLKHATALPCIKASIRFYNHPIPAFPLQEKKQQEIFIKLFPAHVHSMSLEYFFQQYQAIQKHVLYFSFFDKPLYNLQKVHQ